MLRITSTMILVFLSAGAFADNANYQKGTITKLTDGNSPYQIEWGNKKLLINRCGEFQAGQAVEFRVDEDKAYIRRDGGGEYKCKITARSEMMPAAPPDPATIVLKGTILGYGMRRDVSVSSGGSGSTFHVGQSVRKAKVYELKGPELIYQVDYCGAFQAGQFTTGQEVEFRVNEKEGRLYIRHDGTKEYSCQLEGTRLPDNAAAVAPATAPQSAAETKPNSSEDQKK